MIIFKRINSLSVPQTTTELINPVIYESIQSADPVESNQGMNRNVYNHVYTYITSR